MLLRQWREQDHVPFAAMNADPVVMQHFPSTQSRAQSDAMVERIQAHFSQHGFGLWAVEPLTEPGRFLGLVGLQTVPFEAHFTPAVEIGWRLAHNAWGNGYAPEAARRALQAGFVDAGLDEIVSMTTVDNLRSQRVMEKIGMAREPADDFDHPRVPDPRYRRHVLFRIAPGCF